MIEIKTENTVFTVDEITIDIAMINHLDCGLASGTKVMVLSDAMKSMLTRALKARRMEIEAHIMERNET